MSQHSSFNIPSAAQRVNQFAVISHRNSIDTKISAQKILLQCHTGVGEETKAFIASARLSFRAGQCIFFAALTMNKDRKRLANGTKSFVHHSFWRTTYHHPILLFHRNTQQFIAHSAAN